MKKILSLFLSVFMAGILTAGTINCMDYSEILELIDFDYVTDQELESLEESYHSTLTEVIPFLEKFLGDSEDYYLDLSANYGFSITEDEDYSDSLVPMIYFDNGNNMSGYFSQFSIKEDGLHCAAYIRNSSDFNDDDSEISADFYLGFQDFVLKNDGTAEPGQSFYFDMDSYYYTDLDSVFTGNGLIFYLPGAEVDFSQEPWLVTCSDAFLDFDYYESDLNLPRELRIGKTVFDWNGNILSIEGNSEPQKLYSHNQKIFLDISSVGFKDGKIAAQGKIRGTDLNLTATDDAELFFKCSFSGTRLDFDSMGKCSATCEFDGFKINASSFTINQEEVTLYGSEINIEGMTIFFSKLPFVERRWFDESILSYVYKTALSKYESSSGIIISIDPDSPFYGKTVSNPRFTENDMLEFSILLDVRENLPSPLSGIMPAKAYRLYSDGTTEIDWYYSSYGSTHYAKLGNLTFTYDYVSTDSEGNTRFSDVSIRMPDNSLISRIDLYNFSVSPEGKINPVDSYSGYQFSGWPKVCGMTLLPDSMDFTEDSFIISGTMYLPDDIPYSISGDRVSMSLEFGFDGAFRKAYSKSFYLNQFTIPDSTVSAFCRSPCFQFDAENNLCRLMLSDTILYFGSYYSGNGFVIDNMNTDNMYFEFQSGKKSVFNTSDLKLTKPCRLYCGNYSFTADRLAMSGNILEFSGSWNTNDDKSLPEFLRNKRDSAVIKFSSNMDLKEIIAPAVPVSGRLSSSETGPIAVSLLPAYANFSVSPEGSLQLVADSCTLKTDSDIAEVIADKELSAEKLCYQFKNRGFTDLYAESAVFNAENLQPELKDMKLILNSSGFTLKGKAAKTGIDTAGYFGNTDYSVYGTMKYASDGTPEAFSLEYKY